MRKFQILLLLLFLVWPSAAANVSGENPWQIRINIPEFKLFLYHSQAIYRIFQIAVGKEQTPSPVGDFLINTKVVNPTWYPPDGRSPVPPGPENPLGQYWLGLSIKGYGIHGNSAAWSIGVPISLGCFRMHNENIQELSKLVPVGTPVQITYETVHAGIDENQQAWLEVFPDIYYRVNQEAEIQKKLVGLGWVYEPHWKALRELIKGGKPLRVEVPRKIKIGSVLTDTEGFYWKQGVYVAKNYVKAFAGKIKPNRENSHFREYVKIDSGESNWIWDVDLNTLKINRLEVVFNGRERISAGRWNEDGRLLLDLKMVAEALEAKFFWDYQSTAAICNGIMIPGLIREGIFWIETGELESIWPGIRYYWDKPTETLELFK